MRMNEVFITVLNDYVEVSDAGRFELPARDYSAAELKKIARDVNRALRESVIANMRETQEDR